MEPTSYKLTITSFDARDNTARVELVMHFDARPTQPIRIPVGERMVRVLATQSPAYVALERDALVLMYAEDGVGPPVARVKLETAVTKGYGWFSETIAIPWPQLEMQTPMAVQTACDELMPPRPPPGYTCGGMSHCYCDRTEDQPFEVTHAPVGHGPDLVGLSMAGAMAAAFGVFAWRRLLPLKEQLLTFRGVPEGDEPEDKTPDRHHPYRGGRPQPKIDPNEVLPAEALFLVRARVALALIVVVVPAAAVTLWPGAHAFVPRSWILALVVLSSALAGMRYLSSVFVSRWALWIVLLLQALGAGYLIGWAAPATVITSVALLGVVALASVVVASAAALFATGHGDVVFKPSKLDLDPDKAAELVKDVGPTGAAQRKSTA